MATSEAASEASAPRGSVLTGRRERTAGIGSALVRLLPAAIVLWGALCGAGYLLTHPLRDTAFERWDGSANRWLAARRTATGNTITHWLTFAAETMTVIAIGLLFFVALRIALHRWRESMFLAVALLGEVTIFVSTTFMIDRNRPAVRHLDGAPPTSSFPSGHTAAAITLYGALAIIAVRVGARAWLRGLALTLAVLVPACVAFARLYRGMHYPTDVLGGAVLGLAWLLVCWAVLLRGRPAVPNEERR
jgi:membrane-associated phospholipid phosphatase